MRSRVLAVVETVGVGLVTVGVGMWSVPAALVVAGLAAVAAVEVRG